MPRQPFRRALLATVFACWEPAPAARISEIRVEVFKREGYGVGRADAGLLLGFGNFGGLRSFPAARSAGLGDIFIEILPPFLAFLSSFGSAGLGDGLSRTFWEVFFAGAGFGGVLKTVFFAPAAGLADGFFAGAFCPEAADFSPRLFPARPKRPPPPCHAQVLRRAFYSSFLRLVFSSYALRHCFFAPRANAVFWQVGKNPPASGTSAPFGFRGADFWRFKVAFRNFH